ncbi:hypothetical protein R1flu_022896 [Riccia fluitans]|uniref:Uncharacterized protein n=1 Tax=Riccia fluitans TaxID=41844 RepID=A0ABD1XQZ8_9MARC
MGQKAWFIAVQVDSGSAVIRRRLKSSPDVLDAPGFQFLVEFSALWRPGHIDGEMVDPSCHLAQQWGTENRCRAFLAVQMDAVISNVTPGRRGRTTGSRNHHSALVVRVPTTLSCSSMRK